MSDKKISQLTAATTPLDGTEVLPIVQSGSTVKVANNDLRPKQIQSNATSGVLQIAGPAAAATRVMTTPDANFTAARTDAGQTFSGLQNFSFTGGNGPVVNRTDGAGYINFQSAGVNNTQIGEDGAGGFTLYTNLAVSAKQPMIWRADGDVRLQVGNLVPYVAGKGVNFTANTPAAGMTSQLLNWYEEGTWTPTLTTDGTDFTSVTYDPLTAGKYTRIGRVVYINGNIRTDAVTVGSASGNVQIGGLPFSAVAPQGCFAFSQAEAWATNQPSSGETTGTKIYLFYRATANGVTTLVPVSNVATGANSNLVFFSGFYFV